eukprot:CAMPEP_0197462910 /NCGR_PEP_ID=MMETSP1175-20131217/60365_1 /TAXON_ID=1003142 /ORGANISM="Triceratium dubium, Strain CCMP147" /LENGTH=38 /DNA_ID= /DNA_START= /DNA_END= /DNA_ORIENTATION=
MTLLFLSFSMVVAASTNAAALSSDPNLHLDLISRCMSF